MGRECLWPWPANHLLFWGNRLNSRIALGADSCCLPSRKLGFNHLQCGSFHAPHRRVVFGHLHSYSPTNRSCFHLHCPLKCLQSWLELTSLSSSSGARSLHVILVSARIASSQSTLFLLRCLVHLEGCYRLWWRLHCAHSSSDSAPVYPLAEWACIHFLLLLSAVVSWLHG